MRKLLEECPSCGGSLKITEVHCTRCDTQIRSHYRPCDFCSLSEEQSTFLKIFVLSRGNLSEVEKRLGISYPTVRSKLDEIIDRLTSEQVEYSAQPPVRNERRIILDAIARGELSAEEGMERIRALSGRA